MQLATAAQRRKNLDTIHGAKQEGSRCFSDCAPVSTNRLR